MKKIISEHNKNKLINILAIIGWSVLFVFLMANECNAQVKTEKKGTKYFSFLKSRSAKLDETYTKLEIVDLEKSKYILTRDTTDNGIISFVYTPLEDVFKGLEERFNECDKELEKIGIELETLQMRRKVLLEKKARIEYLMSQQ